MPMKIYRDDWPAVLGGTPVRPQGAPDWPGVQPAVAKRVQEALDDGSWGKYHGPHTIQLARTLAQAHEAQHVFLCASGTAAVELALRGLAIGPGDEVILAAYDFQGNFSNVVLLGAVPVLVDVLPENWNLDPEQLDAAIGPRTKAIIASHLHGGVIDMPEVMRIARARGVAVIEDACQLPGARVHGRMAGTWGDVGILSFGGSKLLSAGRGGAAFTSRDDVAQRIRLYTQRGNDAYPLSELQAAALLPQWDELAAARERRVAGVAWLVERINFFAPALVPFTNAPSDSLPDYYKLGLRYAPDGFPGLGRDLLAQSVRAEGIALDPGFRALHRTHASRRFRAVGQLSQATLADAGVLVLHHPVLQRSEDDLNQVLEALERAQHHAAAIAAAPGATRS
ncbi:MAG: DegT/DnrJ/EryC1/StrS family aminotransferase [Planctomycetales bacterium]